MWGLVFPMAISQRTIHGGDGTSMLGRKSIILAEPRTAARLGASSYVGSYRSEDPMSFVDRARFYSST